MRRNPPLLRVLAIPIVFAIAEGSAFAHISVEQGGTHLSRYGDSELKDGPCGRANGTRGTHIYHYSPGQTIQVKMVEFIPHPSYFRIAFDNDGDDGFIEPQSIDPIDPMRPCPFNAADKCGPSDYYNSPTVLPGMDDLYPHNPTAFAAATYTFDVTLPNVTCDNCTLQIIQVMEDTVHGAYNPTEGDPNDLPAYVPDIYHQCIDLVLQPGSDGGVVPGPDASTTQAGTSSSKDEGGCSVVRGGVTSGAAYWMGALVLGALGARRSRPRRRTR